MSKPPDRGRKALTIQLLGIDPANAGAVLMLLAIKREISARFPDARLAVDWTTPIEARLRHGLWSIAGASGGRASRLLAATANAAPARVRRKVGLLSAAEVGTVIDASGFAYGDFWGVDKFVRRIGRRMHAWRRAGAKVIFMPQAWGPFTEPGSDAQIATALNTADLVFARDTESLGHLGAAGVAGARLAPDFTNALPAAVAAVPEEQRGLGLLIPNAKLLAARGEEARSLYLDYLEASLGALRRCSPKAMILIHEGAGDRAIAEALNARLSQPAPILDPGDALAAKALIGASRAVISSRFHGLVSALSSGVPSMSCGWSHKYGALMQDYGADAFTVDLGDVDCWRGQLEAFVTAVADGSAAARVIESAIAEKRKTAQTWDLVLAEIAR
jgi:colanic acid/amylovoran biosynthesis protein